MLQVPEQRGLAPASRLGVQPGQLHADPGAAQKAGALVVDDDRGEAGCSWPIRHLPDG